jgi:hypothetical protein
MSAIAERSPLAQQGEVPVEGSAGTESNEAAPGNDLLPARLPGQGIEWCGTQQKWEAKGLGGVAGAPACPTLGICDVPAVRDSWISAQPISLNIHFNVFANSDGSNPAATQASVDAQAATLNSDFAPVGISFCATTTFINDTTYRQYSSATEEAPMKNLYADSPATKLNVYVVNTSDFGGRGTFPWDPEALGNLGGIEIDDNAFGPGQSTLTHEVGHNLGLWHTHHGVSEVSSCSVCYERADGLNADTTGDLAGDTDPTPTNFTCGGPGGNDPCSATPWGPTDPQNYMGYAGDPCWSEFSPHQFGRMHCWIDEVLTSWSCIGAPGEAKFSQPPDNTGELIQSDIDWSDMSPNTVNAEDFVSDGRPIHGVLWWGMDLVGPPVSSAAAPPTAPPSPTTQSTVVLAAQAVPVQLPDSSVAVGGDTCAAPAVIGAVPYSDTGNTCAFLDDYDEACPDAPHETGGRDVVYAFTPGANVNVDITLCGNSAYDTKLYVYESACQAPLSGLWEACSDDLCTTPSFPDPFVSAVFDVALTASTTYYIIVDGWSAGDCGNYTLDITPVICGDGILGGNEQCDPPDGVTCNAFCQFIVCGNGVVDGVEQCDPPNGYDCSNACTFIPVFPIDGWLISFHEPLATGGSAATPLGLYFCDKSVISIQRKTLASCDARPVNEYRVELADCCLIHAYPDSRNSLTPAQADAFHETACFAYDLDIQAVVGAKWVDSGGTCVETPTGNTAPGPFWGWHTTGIEEGSRGALTTSVSMSGSDWLYGPWSAVVPSCSMPNMAFQVLTDTPEPPGGQDCDDNGIYDVCETGADCQPNGVFDQCEITTGVSTDCEPNGMPDECDIRDFGAPDCQLNGAIDHCEIAAETADDCNGNLIPDECDITAGAIDCQPDGVPDACQLGTNDANSNGIPDQCDPAPLLAGAPPNKNRVLTVSGFTRAQLDDGSAENAIGATNPNNSGKAFGWATGFRNTTGAPLTILAVEVAFGTPGDDGQLAVGNAVDGVVWIDAAATGNMVNATRVARWSLPGGVHAIDGTYGTFQLPASVIVPAGADYYVGFGDIRSSMDTLNRFPASMDTSSSDGRSWFLVHPTTDTFDPDNLANQVLGTIDSFGLPGDWLIRPRLGGLAALRVAMMDLQNPQPANPACCPPQDFSTYEHGGSCADPSSCVRWIGQPSTYYDAPGSPNAGQAYRAARLQCTPLYRDWSGEGFFHVYGAEVMPSSRYHVEAYPSICAGNEGSCVTTSPPVVLQTARWGDVAPVFNPPGTTTQPDALDVAALVNKFKALPGAPSAIATKLRDDVLNLLQEVDALDIANDVDGAKGFAFSYDGPCPCPSTVTCNATPCANASACSGGLCIRTCTSGPKTGEFCTNNEHCGVCTGGSRDTLPCDAAGDCPDGGACDAGACGSGSCRDRCGRCSP